MKKSCFFIICILLFSHLSYPLVTVRGDSTDSPFGFSENITTSTFDSQTGSVFVGLESGANAYSIARAVRPNFRTVSKFYPVANNVLTNQSIEFLSNIPTNPHTILAAVAKGSNVFNANTITILSTEGSRFATTGSLNDASGSNATEGIVGIAQSTNILTTENTERSYALAAVRSNGGNFGDANSGLAYIEIDTSLLTTIITTIKDATTGQDGNKAQELAANSIYITGGTNSVTFLGGTDENKVVVHYDEVLNRFYIGVRIQTAANANAIGKAIIVGYTTGNGALNLQAIVPNSAIATDPIAGTNYIVAAKSSSTQLKTFHIQTMHTSTNYDYLITNSLSNANTTTPVTNEVYALPLVRNDNVLERGTIAKTDPLIQHGPFTTAATAPDDMVTSRSAAALIGGGPLPIEEVTEIQQIEVVDDVVYVGLGNSPDMLNSVGIFYSQAQFGPQGNIINWTQWAKRAAPIDTFPAQEDTNTRINFFHTDPVTGNIWIGENTNKQHVAITSWTDSDITAGTKRLLSALNERLTDGCFSVLDLESATRDFTNRQTGNPETDYRYALFGGYETVTFALTSKIDTTLPETIAIDYDLPESIRTTYLPGAGVITNIAYSKRIITPECDTNPEFIPNNFFFASSDGGLYVFAQSDGSGFHTSTLQALNATPISTGRWTKVAYFTDPVIDIKSEGNVLYVLTSGFTQENPFVDKLYVIPFDQPTETISELFDLNNIHLIAQTGVGIFTNVTHFKEVAIIATDHDQDIPVDITANIIVDRREQIVLATTNGLFVTNANQTNDDACNFSQGSADAQNQNEANWSQVTNTDGTLFLGVSSTDSPIHHTTWPFSLQDPLRCHIFNAGSIHQISGSENPDEITDNPPAQTGIIGDLVPYNFTSNGDIVYTDDPITDFWTDGGRRFFIFNSLQEPSQQNILGTFTFNIQKYPPLPSPILTHPIIEKQKQFYWIQMIGRQGRLFAGTNNGIISLQ